MKHGTPVTPPILLSWIHVTPAKSYKTIVQARFKTIVDNSCNLEVIVWSTVYHCFGFRLSCLDASHDIVLLVV